MHGGGDGRYVWHLHVDIRMMDSLFTQELLQLEKVELASLRLMLAVVVLSFVCAVATSPGVGWLISEGLGFADGLGADLNLTWPAWVGNLANAGQLLGLMVAVAGLLRGWLRRRRARVAGPTVQR
jgi:hypothetical protein